jgi:hypothetical protein
VAPNRPTKKTATYGDSATSDFSILLTAAGQMAEEEVQVQGGEGQDPGKVASAYAAAAAANALHTGGAEDDWVNDSDITLIARSGSGEVTKSAAKVDKKAVDAANAAKTAKDTAKKAAPKRRQIGGFFLPRQPVAEPVFVTETSDNAKNDAQMADHLFVFSSKLKKGKPGPKGKGKSSKSISKSGRVFACGVNGCKKEYTTKNALVRHMFAHTGVRRRRCVSVFPIFLHFLFHAHDTIFHMHSVSRHFDSRVACSFRLSPPSPPPASTTLKFRTMIDRKCVASAARILHTSTSSNDT